MTEKGEISTKKAWLIILVSLIDDIIILVVVFGLLWYFKVELPLWAMIIIGLVLATYIYVRTWAVLPSLRRKTVTGAEGMIGLEGEVVEQLTPNGIIRVCGETWKAKSVEGNIESGEDVVILKMDRLCLDVKRKE